MQFKTIFFTLILLCVFTSAYANEDIWLMVDTKNLEMTVKSGDTTLAHFPNISIGRNGAGFKQKLGDDITPLGQYKISWINRDSRYMLFYGFNYPSRENIKTALKKGLVNKKTYYNVINAHKNNEIPPQNTPVGGMIGIHGLGLANKKIHETMNWTHGCIALSNEQIIKLDTLIKKDTKVIIK